MTGLASVPSNGNCKPSGTTTHTTTPTLAALSDRLIAVFGVKETEQNWQEMDEIIKAMTMVIASDPNGVSRGELQEIAWRTQYPLVAALQTERTRLALSAMELMAALSNGLRDSFDTLYDVYVPPLLRLSERANKVFNSKAQSVLLLMTTNDPHRGCKYHVHRIAESLQSANKILRGTAAEMLLSVAKSNKRGGDCDAHQLHAMIVEMTVKCLMDAQPNVRQTGRFVFAELDEEQRSELIQRVPQNVLKSLGVKPPPSHYDPTSSLPSIPIQHVNTSQMTSVANTPSKFVDLLNSAKSAKSTTTTATTTTAHSRLPIGPAKRPSAATAVSKTAARVIKNVFEVHAEDLILDLPITAITTNTPSTSDPKQRDVKLVDMALIKEWNKRAEHVELVRTAIGSFEATPKQHLKLWETAIAAVSDVHFRVIEAGLRLSGDLLSVTWMAEWTERRGFVEEVLVRAAMAMLANRSRKSVMDAVDRLMASVDGVFGGERLLCHHYPSILSRLDVLGSPRLKAQLLKLFESTVKCSLQGDGRQLLSDYISRGPLLVRVCGALTDSEQSLAQASRAFLLVTVAAIGRRLGEERLMPAIRSPAARALLMALMDANASLLPRSPRHRFLPGDDEIMFEQHIDVLAVGANLAGADNRADNCADNVAGGADNRQPPRTPSRTLTMVTVDELADQLSKTPIK